MSILKLKNLTPFLFYICILLIISCVCLEIIKSKQIQNRQDVIKARELEKETLEMEILREKLKNLKESNANAKNKSRD